MKRQSRFTNRKNSIKNLLHKINLFEFFGILGEIGIAIVVVAIVLWIFRPIAGWVLLSILILLWFRIANDIPLIGRRWVWFFGKRKLWDWMLLLCAPLILSILGLTISSSINNGQGDISLISDRLNISNEYYKQMSELILKQDFQNLVKSKKDKLEQDLFFATVMDKDEFYKYQYCNPIENPLTSIGYVRTISTLRSLSTLKTSTEPYTPLKRGIIQLLYYSKLINRGGHIISLQKAELDNTDLSNISLANSCFDSVTFEGSNLEKTDLTKSTLRRANLKKTNLKKAKLEGVILGSQSSLAEADARNVNLSNADLHETKLIKTNLQGANLRGANLLGADLSEADLSGADLRGTLIDEKTKLLNTIYNTKHIRKDKIENPFFTKIMNFLNLILKTEYILSDSVNLGPTNFDNIYFFKNSSFEILSNEQSFLSNKQVQEIKWPSKVQEMINEKRMRKLN